MPCGDNPAVEFGFGYSVDQSAWGHSGNSGTCYDRWDEPTGFAIRYSIQEYLKGRGRYDGPLDGIWGPNTVKGIQCTITKGNYYSGPIDGVPGVNTVRGVYSYAYYSSYGPPLVLPLGKETLSRYYYGDTVWQAFSNRLYYAQLLHGHDPCD